MNERRPPDKRTDLPHCYASGLTEPRSCKEGMRSEHSPLCQDTMNWKATGLVDAGT